MTEEQREFDAGEVVYIICKLTRYSIANEAYAASDASANYPTYTVTDHNGVQKAGYITVTTSTGFTEGLTVTGGTSGATGVIESIVDGTTLELQSCTGVWVSGEEIKDTDTGDSDTTSALTGIPMTNQETGYYYIAYTIPSDCAAGWCIVKFATESDNTISYDGFLVKR